MVRRLLHTRAPLSRTEVLHNLEMEGASCPESMGHRSGFKVGGKCISDSIMPQSLSK